MSTPVPGYPSPTFRCLLLLLLAWFLGGLFSSSIFSLLTRIPVGGATDTPRLLGYTQILTTTLTLVLPSLLTLWFARYNRLRYIEEIGWRLRGKSILWATLFYSVLFPLSIVLGEWVNLLPEALSPFVQHATELEAQSNAALRTMLSDHTFSGICRNIFAVVVLAPFAEELFMRGALLGCIREHTRRTHPAVWIVAMIFSAVHFQLTAFLPRVLLGAALGYIAVYAGVGTAIVVHGLNNLYALIGYYTRGTVNDIEWKGEYIWWVISIFLLPLAYIFYRKLRSVSTHRKFPL